MKLKHLKTFLLILITVFPLQAKQLPTYGINVYNDLKYPSDFTHFDYVNPNAPKQGLLRLSTIGSFDSLNPFIIEGTPAAGTSYLYATLTKPSQDEILSEYGYVAEKIDLAEDRLSIKFTLRKSAQFHDGTPITAKDVVFTFNTLMEKGNPRFRSYYRDVSKVEALDTYTVKVSFKTAENKELPVIVGEIPILSEAYYKTHDFTKPTLKAPLGSGPYKIAQVEAGRSITYERIKNWWGEKLPVNLGSYNYEEIKLIYFRDPTIALQAFKAGDIDFRLETTAKVWATEYNTLALKRGDMIKKEVRQYNAQGMQGFVFNTRKPYFQDPKVRKAIAYAFNFQWVNKELFYSEYKRSNSYFENSDLAARGLPEGEELSILSKYRKELPDQVFTQPFEMPIIGNNYTLREALEQASSWLNEAGWEIKNEVLLNKKTGEPFKFEILIAAPGLERVINSFVQNLKYLGIQAKIRLIDPNIYFVRVNDFDFDMIMASFPQSNSPGNEQWNYWGSKAADIKGSNNYAGIHSSIIDHLIGLIIDANTRKDLVERTRALDRVLLWHFYVVNGWYSDYFRIAYWNVFGFPKITPKYGLGIDTWWYDEEKAKTIKRS